jgi:hypothetical protein
MVSAACDGRGSSQRATRGCPLPAPRRLPSWLGAHLLPSQPLPGRLPDLLEGHRAGSGPAGPASPPDRWRATVERGREAAHGATRGGGGADIAGAFRLGGALRRCGDTAGAGARGAADGRVARRPDRSGRARCGREGRRVAASEGRRERRAGSDSGSRGGGGGRGSRHLRRQPRPGGRASGRASRGAPRGWPGADGSLDHATQPRVGVAGGTGDAAGEALHAGLGFGRAPRRARVRQSGAVATIQMCP